MSVFSPGTENELLDLQRAGATAKSILKAVADVLGTDAQAALGGVVAQRYDSGVEGAGKLTLSEEQKDGIRKLGLDPERISRLSDATDFEEWKRIKAQMSGGAA